MSPVIRPICCCTGDLAVDPARLAPDRVEHWTDERVRATAPAHYQGYDAH
ncbi:hypothetical protein [Nocardia sp. CY41]|nr:hypothetical protein [Nocardia sp. CY41]